MRERFRRISGYPLCLSPLDTGAPRQRLSSGFFFPDCHQFERGKSKPSRRVAGSPGFSLIELVVTLAILAVLASLAMPFAQLAAQRHKEQELRVALRDIRRAIDSYKDAVQAGRIKTTADASGYPPDLLVLVEGTLDATDPSARKRILFLRRIPRDPFADDAIPAEDTWGLRSYESPHDAPQPGEDVFDVHSLSDKTGLNGIPYSEW